MRSLVPKAVPIVGMLLSAVPAMAAMPPVVDDAVACTASIGGAERSAGVPAGLLAAIGRVESGRVDPRTGAVAAWPWTINVAGTGYFFPNRVLAIAAVETARAAGVQSIDVGCMQINLLQHPAAFATLDDAFEPRLNVAYAAGFLTRLFARTNDWAEAAAAYHSQTPAIAGPYRDRVLATWGGAAAAGVVVARAPAPVVDANRLPGLRARLAESAADRDALVMAGVAPGRAPAGSARAHAGAHVRHLADRRSF